MQINQPILHTENLAIGYGNHAVLEKLNLHVENRSLNCLIGPNGVGKSTLLRTLSGLQRPVGGHIYLSNQNLKGMNQNQIAKQLAVVLTDKIGGNLTVYELIAMGRYPYTNWTNKLSDKDEQAIEEAISATHIQYLKHEKIFELSDGQLQKVMIARALAQDSPLIILDEPTAHLDIANTIDIMQLLKELVQKHAKSILLSTHSLELALELADSLWLANCGSPIISGAPEDLLLLGEIEKLYPQRNIYFDRMNAKFSLLPGNKEHDYNINGNEIAVEWTIKALERNSIYTNTVINIEELNTHKYVWRVKDKSFNSLKNLCLYFRKNHQTKRPGG